MTHGVPSRVLNVGDLELACGELSVTDYCPADACQVRRDWHTIRVLCRWHATHAPSSWPLVWLYAVRLLLSSGHSSSSVVLPSPPPGKRHGLGPRFPLALSGHRVTCDQSVLRMGVGPIRQGDLSSLGISRADRDTARRAGEPDMRLSLPFRQGESPRDCRCSRL